MEYTGAGWARNPTHVWAGVMTTRAVPEEIIGIKGGGGGGRSVRRLWTPISNERLDCRRRQGEWMELHATQAQKVRCYRSGSEMRQARDQRKKVKSKYDTL